MGVRYEAVTWNGFKKRYDLMVLAAASSYMALFMVLSLLVFPDQNMMTVLIRGFGTLAILLLHLIMAIGPAARLSPSFLPLLYNRRHLGVLTFFMGAAHALLSISWFHGGGNVHPLASLFTANTHYDSLPWFPFEVLGAAALLIMSAMAATSHDVWLFFLGPRAWKALHMLVYMAYILLIAHVALGILQLEQSNWLVLPLVLGVLMISVLHILAARKDTLAGHANIRQEDETWVAVGRTDEFPNDRAKVVCISGERIAIFNNKGSLSAVHNVCKHQMGPLGEGKIVDGCITCPWHGFQYRPEDGCAPEPFHEKLHTYRLKREGDMIYLDPKAMAEGTAVEPVRISMSAAENSVVHPFFIGWRAELHSPLMRTPMRVAVAFVLLALSFAALFVHEQRKLTPFRMDYDHVKVIDGWLTATPVPMIRVREGVDGRGSIRYKDILLSDAGKFGADGLVKEVLHGQRTQHVKLTGYVSRLVEHCGADSVDCGKPCTQCLTGTDEYPVMEIGEAGLRAFQFQSDEASAPAWEVPASMTRPYVVLAGEIVDPKCYFGAMNPGLGKTHLSCAARCLSGGIMPLLRRHDTQGERFSVMVGQHGESISAWASGYTALPVRVAGRVAQMDNWEIIFVTSIELDKK